MRLLLILAVVAMLGSAFALYAVNHETRRLADSVQDRERGIAEMQRDIAILKAERAHLARPSRIGEAARELGLVPARRDQFIPASEADPLGFGGSKAKVR